MKTISGYLWVNSSEVKLTDDGELHNSIRKEFCVFCWVHLDLQNIHVYLNLNIGKYRIDWERRKHINK